MLYIVIFELTLKSKSDDNIVTAIKSTNVWARLSCSSYIIETTETAEELRNRLILNLEDGDKIFISYITPPAAWHGYNSGVTKWINEKL